MNALFFQSDNYMVESNSEEDIIANNYQRDCIYRTTDNRDFSKKLDGNLGN